MVDYTGDNEQRKTILIFGVNGMLGHKVYQVLKADGRFKVYGTIRGKFATIRHFRFFDKKDIIEKVNILSQGLADNTVYQVMPDVVINCIGIVKQSPMMKSEASTIITNSVFPHQLYETCHPLKKRLIHISTDCVFSGKKGNYYESNTPDALDLYGQTKYLGEIEKDGSLTIRTSIIGPELGTSRGLLEWFISNKGGEVNGYSMTAFSGFPTIVFAKVLKHIIVNYPDLWGLYHVASNPISKYMLLNMINDRMDLDVKINKDTVYRCFRDLNAWKFKEVTGYSSPPWREMIDELVDDVKQYSKWR